MDVEEYISNVKRTNPKIFKADAVKITPAALEVLLRRAYKVGHDHGHGKGLREANPPSIMESIFGKLR